jgi:hypothetical protein
MRRAVLTLLLPLSLLLPAGTARADIPPLPVVSAIHDDSSPKYGSLQWNGDPFFAYGFVYGFGKDPSGNPRQPFTEYLDNPTEEAKLNEITGDMAQVHDMGANTLRVRIEFGQIMPLATKYNGPALLALQNVLEAAQNHGIYIIITGLWNDEQTTPAWYDHLDQAGRWQAQANFWKLIAWAGEPYSNVLEYDLAAEPTVPSAVVSSWYMETDSEFPGPQYIVKTPGQSSTIEAKKILALQWIDKLKTSPALRTYDPSTPVSVGTFPDSKSFAPDNIASRLEVLTPHVYDKPLREDPEIIKENALTGDPVILGETYPWHTGPDAMHTFLYDSRPWLDGTLMFFDGRTAEQARADADADTDPDDAYLDRLYANAMDTYLSLHGDLCLNRCHIQALGGG